MNKLARNLAAALLFFSMTAVTLADGQMGLPLTGPSQCLTCDSSQGQTDTTSQDQTATPSATSPTGGESASQTDSPLMDAGLFLFESFSSII